MSGFEIRPRFVWSRRPRVNGGRRRPRGWMGRYKLRPVTSRASYALPTPRLALPPAPRLEQFPIVLIELAPTTGNPAVDADLRRLSTLYGGISQVRLLLLARREVKTTAKIYRAETARCWNTHDQLVATAVALRETLILDHGVELPAVPKRFFCKF